MQAALEKIGSEVNRSPQNAGLAVAADGTITVQPSRTVVALDLPKSVSATRAVLFAFGADEVTLPSTEVPVTRPMLSSAARRIARWRSSAGKSR